MKKEIHRSNFLSLLEFDVEGHKFEASHEHQSDGFKVLIVPYKVLDRDGQKAIMVLGRREINPAWSEERLIFGGITGSIHNGEQLQQAILELEEEVGLKVNEDELEDLGTCRGSKSSTSKYYLFGVEVSRHPNTDPYDYKTDGSFFDQGTPYWTAIPHLMEDAQFCTAVLRLITKHKIPLWTETSLPSSTSSSIETR